MKQITKRSKSKKNQAKSKTKQVGKEKKGKKKEKIQAQEELNTELPSSGFEITIDGDNLKVKMHKVYIIERESELAGKVRNWLHLFLQKEKRRNIKIYRISQFSYFPTFEFELMGEKPDQEKCSICQFEYDNLTEQEMEDQLIKESENDIVALPCSHLVHYECLRMLIGEKEWIKCPVCSTIYGKMIGDQPEGTMTWSVNDMLKCDEFDCGTITISYSMHSGKRGNISYPSTHRIAYLPNNEEGQEVLKLLQEAFNRKLIFTIGRSVTTGRDNQIVWNGIHHKTNTHGGSSHFGYPDPTYFQRVKLELAAKGIHPMHQ